MSGVRSPQTWRARRSIAFAVGQPPDGPATARASCAPRSSPGARARLEPAVDAASKTDYPGIEHWFPSAGRMQRAVADLSGLRADGGDTRPWLRHAAWPERFHPLDRRRCTAAAPGDACTSTSYPFVPVQGDGVHEIAVGPVHAGIIEPGHFRFSVVGEKVLRLEERLGYVHKGIERRFTELPLLERPAIGGARLRRFGGRLFVGLLPGARRHGAAHVAAREHPGCGRLRWSWSGSPIIWAISARSATMPDSPLDLRSSPGSRSSCCARPNRRSGSVTSWTSSCRAARASICRRPAQRSLIESIDAIMLEVGSAAHHLRRTRGIARSIRGRGCRRRRRWPRTLGLPGLAGRASGQAFDLRCDLPCDPYDDLQPRKVVRQEGDVAARVAVRFDEATESRTSDAADSAAAAERFASGRRFSIPARGRLGNRIDRGLARPGIGRARSGRRRHDPALSSRTILRGKTGRCSSMPSSTISCRIFR